MSETDTIIPVRVRTARVRHPCAGVGERCGGIEPGDRYEDWRLPPQRDVNTGDQWWKLKVHYPSRPASGADGCELAAAYREHEAWLVRAEMRGLDAELEKELAGGIR